MGRLLNAQLRQECILFSVKDRPPFSYQIQSLLFYLGGGGGLVYTETLWMPGFTNNNTLKLNKKQTTSLWRKCTTSNLTHFSCSGINSPTERQRDLNTDHKRPLTHLFPKMCGLLLSLSWEGRTTFRPLLPLSRTFCLFSLSFLGVDNRWL
jgi:hypothetical protein